MMNKYQEALDIIVEKTDMLNNTCLHLPKCMKNGICHYVGEGLCEDYERVKLLQELVDKETPTKVTHQAAIHSCCTCPNCLNVVDDFEEDYLGKRVRVTFDYCRFCGQKLEWESDE